MFTHLMLYLTTARAEALMQWLKLWPSSLKKLTVSSTFTREDLILPLGPRGSVLGLRPPGFEFRILRFKGSFSLFISPSSGGSPGPV